MSNPTINFRLSPYQLARGLQIIRQLEPDYKITSLSQIVKVIYYDYLAKMSLNLTDEVPEELLIEINLFIAGKSNKSLTLGELILQEQEKQLNKAVEESKEAVNETIKSAEEVAEEAKLIAELTKENLKNQENSEKSEISSVSDFSPPEEWKE